MDKQESQDLGIFLKQAIAEFYEDNEEDSLLTVLAILIDCQVFVPCQLAGKEDGEPQKYLSKDDALYEPAILENGEEHYYLAFSAKDEMEQYGRQFLTLRCPFMQLLGVAREHKDDLDGIVVNTFHEPLGLSWDLLDVLESMAPKPDFSYTIPPEDS